MLEIITENEEYIKFKIQCDISMANALRRIMIAEVPSTAIDQVKMITNTSCLADEFISHRLGLIPIKDIDAEYSLNIKAEKMMHVTAKDLHLSLPAIPITILQPDQELILETILKIGCGKEHAKWSPVSTVTLQEISKNKFEFVVESTGSLLPKEIVKRAFQILYQKLEILKKKINK